MLVVRIPRVAVSSLSITKLYYYGKKEYENVPRDG